MDEYIGTYVQVSILCRASGCYCVMHSILVIKFKSPTSLLPSCIITDGPHCSILCFCKQQILYVQLAMSIHIVST